MDKAQESYYWLDVAVREITAKYPDGEIVVSSGISPSASYHIGHFREILTADALAWGLRKAGRKVTHKHVVDNFDPLRKRYDFLPQDYEQYVGWPISLVPDPFDECRGEHKTYAEHFYREFEGYARQMGITELEVVRSYEDLYHSGKMADQIEKVIDKASEIRQIFKDISKRELSEDWLPLQLLGPNNSFDELSYKSIDTAAKTITGVDEAGGEHVLDYTLGQVKMNWRLDWPARWQVLGVLVEPFSAQEHGAAGSSYDTGVAFSEKVFGYPAPMPGVRYANIHMVGDTKKMSSSKGNLVTPEQALKIMPAEILRYFVVRSKPDRTLFFDPGVGLFNLIDEFSQIQEGQKYLEFKEAYKFATASAAEKVITSVPFNHLVTTYQTARADFDEILKTLERAGWKPANDKEVDILRREVEFVKNWLDKYAPESVKFSVQDKLPSADLTDSQKSFLSILAELVEAQHEVDGQKMHDLIYEAKEKAELSPADAFKALYRVILNQESGPKAGWFLASLDHEWLVKRLKLEQ
jgi:lysyl-tRNA synthetase class 1